MTHHATSNMTEWGFHMMMACQMAHGRPRSTMSPQITSTYPRNAVRIVGRRMGRNRSMLKMYTVAAMAKPAGGETDADQDINADPDSPGKRIEQIGGGTEPHGESLDGRNKTRRHEDDATTFQNVILKSPSNFIVVTFLVVHCVRDRPACGLRPQSGQTSLRREVIQWIPKSTTPAATAYFGIWDRTRHDRSGIGSFGKIHRESELLEGNRGQEHHRGPPRLLESVDVVHVGTRRFVDPLPGFPDKIVASPNTVAPTAQASAQAVCPPAATLS